MRILVAVVAALWAGSLAAQVNTQATAPSAALLAQPHPFGVQDMVRMERVGSPIPSPDGQWLVFTVRSWDEPTNKTTTNLWLTATDGSKLRQLTAAKGRADTSPVWSPDGRTIAFTSNRTSPQQIWTIGIDGGEAAQLTNFPVDAENLRWSPTGSHLAFSAEVYPDADMAKAAERDKAKSDNPVKATKFDRLFIRHWDAWEDGKRSHIFVLPVKRELSQWKATGEPLDVMKGVDADCPTKPFGGVEEFAWSPDGKEIAYTAQLADGIAW